MRATCVRHQRLSQGERGSGIRGASNRQCGDDGPCGDGRHRPSSEQSERVSHHSRPLRRFPAGGSCRPVQTGGPARSTLFGAHGRGRTRPRPPAAEPKPPNAAPRKQKPHRPSLPLLALLMWGQPPPAVPVAKRPHPSPRHKGCPTLRAFRRVGIPKHNVRNASHR